VAAILILDTCAILDLVRAPVRREFNVSYSGRARAVLAAARQTNPQVELVVSDLVRTEFQRNLPHVLEDATAQLGKRCDEYRHAVAIVAAYSDTPAMPSVDAQWVEQNIKHGHRLAEDLLAAAVIVPAADDDQIRANRRVWTRTAPAETGNNNLADCVITEIALRIARMHAPNVSGTRIAFFSSNATDFCEARSLKSTLQVEFDAVGLQYVRNWGEAWAATVRMS
jgi:hypothetical protein